MSSQDRISPYNTIHCDTIYTIYLQYIQYIYNIYNIFLNKIQFQVDRWWEKRKIIRGLLVDPIPNSPN